MFEVIILEHLAVCFEICWPDYVVLVSLVTLPKYTHWLEVHCAGGLGEYK